MVGVCKRIGRAAAPAIFLALGVFVTWRFIDRTIGAKIAAAFFNAENSMALWTMAGMPLWKALSIGITCSTYDTIFVWYWTFREIHPLLTKAERAMNDITCGAIFQHRARWLRLLVLLSLRGLFVLTIKPSLCEKLRARYDGTFYNVALVGVALMGFIPGCLWLGIFLIVSLEIPTSSALPCLLLGNTTKVAIFGSINATVAGNFMDTTHGEQHVALAVAIVAVFTAQWVVKHTLGKRFA